MAAPTSTSVVRTEFVVELAGTSSLVPSNTLDWGEPLALTEARSSGAGSASVGAAPAMCESNKPPTCATSRRCAGVSCVPSSPSEPSGRSAGRRFPELCPKLTFFASSLLLPTMAIAAPAAGAAEARRAVVDETRMPFDSQRTRSRERRQDRQRRPPLPSRPWPHIVVSDCLMRAAQKLQPPQRQCTHSALEAVTHAAHRFRLGGMPVARRGGASRVASSGHK